MLKWRKWGVATLVNVGLKGSICADLSQGIGKDDVVTICQNVRKVSFRRLLAIKMVVRYHQTIRLGATCTQGFVKRSLGANILVRCR